MAKNLQTANQAGTVIIQKKAAAEPWKRELLAWAVEGRGISEELPEGIAEHLAEATRRIEVLLAPASQDAWDCLTQRMWDAGIPQPEAVTLVEWLRILGGYPADVLEKAFDQIIRTHKWPTPPKIADVVNASDPEMSRRNTWMRKIRLANARAKIDAKNNSAKADKKAKHADWVSRLTDDQQKCLMAVREARNAGNSVASLIADVADHMNVRKEA